MNSDHYLPEALSARTIAVLLMVLLSACSTLPRNTASMPEPTAESHHTREPVVDTEDADRAGAPTSPTDTMLAPSMVEPSNLGEEAALRAIALLGKPYHYGGIDLKGFDCSGLVFYIYRELGIDVPRSALEQHQQALRIARDELLPGDLVFFRINRRRISHVGIYVGDNRFVHAPQTGKQVELRNLDEPYYARHWVDAGRLQ